MFFLEIFRLYFFLIKFFNKKFSNCTVTKFTIKEVGILKHFRVVTTKFISESQNILFIKIHILKFFFK